MSAPFETTAAMTTPGETTAAVTAPGAATAAAPSDPAVPEPQPLAPPAGAAQHESQAAERPWFETVSPNVVITVLGGLIAALLASMMALLVWQFGALANRIDNQGAELGARIDSLSARIDNQGARIDSQGAELGARIDKQGAELRSEIAALRTEMQAGFRAVNETLLDHTDRLARLEAASADPDAES